jgi:hypothetical protein
MLKLLTERDLPKEVAALIKGRTDVRIAVPFWGKDAVDLLVLSRAKGGQIICNLESGCCDPDVIDKLRGRFTVKTHARLHGKLYCTSKAASVGSSNVSTNGLAVTGSLVPLHSDSDSLTGSG